MPDLSDAVAALSAGGVVAYPTEAVYGLGCDPDNYSALEKIVQLKGRDADKGMIIIAAEFGQLAPYLKNPDNTLRDKLNREADTPTTWVVDAAERLHKLLTGGRSTIAVRITQHPTAAALSRSFGGAITSTSANPSGAEPARTAAEVLRQFPQGIDTVVDAAVGDLAQPTRIIDARTNERLR